MSKKILSIITTCLLLSTTLFRSQVFATTNISFESVTEFDENFNTTVTMALDGDIRKAVETDIVFVSDVNYLNLTSNQALIDTIKSFASTFTASGDVNANIALVLYGNSSKTVFDLINVHDITDDTIEQKIEESLPWIESYGFGSNIQSGVLEGHKILDNSTTGSEKDSRHLVLITDGSATTYNNADGVSSTSVFKGSDIMYLPLGNMDSNGDVGSTSRETKMVKYYNETNDYAAAFAKLYEEGAQIEQYAAKGFEYPGGGSYSAEQIERLKALDNAGELTYYTVSDVNDIEKHPYTNTEIGAYAGAKALSDVAQDYNVHTIGYLYEWGFNDDNSFLLKLIALPSRGFVEWARQLGDVYFEETKVIPAEKMSEYFTDIKDEIEESVPEVSVTSEVGSGTLENGYTYEFEFVDDIEKISASIDGEELEKSVDTNGNYVFKKAGVIYFTLELTPKTVDKNTSFKLNIIHSVTGEVKLTYNLALSPESAPKDGEYVDLKDMQLAKDVSYLKQNQEVTTIDSPLISYISEAPGVPDTGTNNISTGIESGNTESPLFGIAVAAITIAIATGFIVLKRRNNTAVIE